MSEFSDRPFVAGSLTGVRAFDVDALGRLHGVTVATIFTPGENTADCKGNRGISFTNHQLQAAMARLGPMNGLAAYALPYSVEVEPAKHTVASKDCACGFYAYFNGSNTYARPDRLTAIIEGYGVCTVGERGFRAEKAKLVAIVAPTTPSRFRKWLAIWWAVVMVAWCSSFAAYYIHDGRWVWAGVMLGLTGLNLSFAIHDHKKRRRATAKSRTRPAIPINLVRRNYPGVPVYPTVKVALAAHPLTPPDPPAQPSPEDADFWTRSASR